MDRNILVVDNSDSFTYNIVQLLRRVTDAPIAVRNSHTLTLPEVELFSHLVFSPGAGVPNEYPIMSDILNRYDNDKSILGICLGHQAICQHYGALLYNLPQVFHGVPSAIRCSSQSQLFRGLEQMTVGRYHSWVAQALPTCLKATATDAEGHVMAVEHLTKSLFGVQFHPESYITVQGEHIVKNFLDAIPT